MVLFYSSPDPLSSFLTIPHFVSICFDGNENRHMTTAKQKLICHAHSFSRFSAAIIPLNDNPAKPAHKKVSII
eukprot:scaffold36524_cov145-Amphora_coffeaeformis.AAC.1